MMERVGCSGEGGGLTIEEEKNVDPAPQLLNIKNVVVVLIVHCSLFKHKKCKVLL